MKFAKSTKGIALPSAPVQNVQSPKTTIGPCSKGGKGSKGGKKY